MCTPGTIIAARTKYSYYVDIRLGIKNLYPGYKVKLINIVFDYLGAYYKPLDKLRTEYVVCAKSTKVNK